MVHVEVNVPALFERAVKEFGRSVQTIGDDQWRNETPCTEWDVRDLVNHLVNENKWVAPLLQGKTIAEVGDAFDGNLLGDDPKGAWTRAAEEAIEATQQEGAMDVTAHLSFGDFPGNFYVGQVLSDHVIHSWDLARGIGDDDRLDPELVDFAQMFLAPQIEAWRQAGLLGSKVEVPQDADDQTKLLGIAGRKT